jgi:hypothetical protein
MTDQEINKAIAEECDFYVAQDESGSGYTLRHGKDTMRYPWRDSSEEAWADASEYTTDLNLIVAEVRRLPLDKRDLYVSFLSQVTQRNRMATTAWTNATATARHHCEALLRMNRKWKETE